jgi:hypothetical protein
MNKNSKVEAKCPELRKLADALEKYWASQSESDVTEALAYVREHIAPDEAAAKANSYREMAIRAFDHNDVDGATRAERIYQSIIRVFPVGVPSETTGEVLTVCECCGNPNIHHPTIH